jgi:hypothetical protein
MNKRRRFLRLSILLVLLVVLGSIMFSIDGSAQGPYPPPATGTPSAPQYYHSVYIPIIVGTFPPPATTSYYIRNITTLYNLGYDLGVNDRYTPGIQDHLVILDYGYPGQQGGVYGVRLTFDPAVFFPMPDVIASAVEFAQGYWNGLGTDFDSHLRIVIGVNNCCNENTVAFFQGHGTAWGQTVNSISSGISYYASQVDVVSGCDMERDWNDPYSTAQWLIN